MTEVIADHKYSAAILVAILDFLLGATFYFWEHSGSVLDHLTNLKMLVWFSSGDGVRIELLLF